MRTFKLCAVFFAVNLLVCLLMNFALTDPSIVKIYLDEIHESGCDTLIIGTSHGETGLDPFLMSEALDANVFNASRRLMSVPDLYYLLRAANENGTIKTVYYELDPSYWNVIPSVSTHDDTCMSRHAPLPDKLRYAADYLWDHNYNYVFFPYDFDAKTLKKAPRIIKSKLLSIGQPADKRIRTIYRHMRISENYDYVGRGFRRGVRRDNNPAPYEPFYFTESLVDPTYVEAFSDMAAYCKEEKIRLVCVISALPVARLQQENHAEAHAYFSALCARHDVPLYDMNMLANGRLARTSEEYTDMDGHMMGGLARRQTEALIDIELAAQKKPFFTDSLTEAIHAM